MAARGRVRRRHCASEDAESLRAATCAEHRAALQIASSELKKPLFQGILGRLPHGPALLAYGGGFSRTRSPGGGQRLSTSRRGARGVRGYCAPRRPSLATALVLLAPARRGSEWARRGAHARSGGTFAPRGVSHHAPRRSLLRHRRSGRRERPLERRRCARVPDPAPRWPGTARRP